MIVKSLEWNDLISQFSKSWIAHTQFNSCYCVYVDRDSGSVIAIDLYRKKYRFYSVEEAKKWCQNDFHEKISLNVLKV